MCCFSVLEVGNLRSRCQLGWSSECCEGESAAGFSAWPVAGHLLPVALHIIFSLFFPFYKNVSHIGVGPTLMISCVFSLNLISSIMRLSPNKFTFWGSGGLQQRYVFSWGHIQPIRPHHHIYNSWSLHHKTLSSFSVVCVIKKHFQIYTPDT